LSSFFYSHAENNQKYKTYSKINGFLTNLSANGMNFHESLRILGVFGEI